MPFPCRSRRVVVPIALILLLFGLAVSARAQEFRVGVFFDDAGQSCVGEIRNFGGVWAHIFALVPDGTEVNGALLSLELPPGITLDDVIFPKEGEIEGELVSSSGLNITLFRCPVAMGPVLLLSIHLTQVDDNYEGGARVPDIQMLLGGGVTPADSLSFRSPQVKLCPDDPLGGDPEFVSALSLRATLNCTSNCPCETSVVAKTWGWVKRRFRGP